MDELHEESDEAHDGEADRGGYGDLLEFLPIWFCAPFHETDGIFHEIAGRAKMSFELIHCNRLYRLCSTRSDERCPLPKSTCGKLNDMWNSLPSRLSTDEQRLYVTLWLQRLTRWKYCSPRPDQGAGSRRIYVRKTAETQPQFMQLFQRKPK